MDRGFGEVVEVECEGHVDAVEEWVVGGVLGEEGEDPGAEVVGGVEGAGVVGPGGARCGWAEGEDGAEARGEGGS